MRGSINFKLPPWWFSKRCGSIAAGVDAHASTGRNT